jgi:hypothetical protein
LREQVQVQEWFARAEALVGAARAYQDQVTQEAWDTLANGQPVTLEQQARCRLAASFAVDCAVQAVELMYRAGGTTSIERGQLIGRCARDIQVLAQNFTVAPEYYVHTGRVLLGLDPGPKMA